MENDPPADLLTRIMAIESRNARVEADKAWETSWTRRALIGVLTYAVVAIYMQVVVHIDPWINALVPTIAFLISTLALGVCKRTWIARRERRR